ncbi:MAG: hypothetical protein RL076_77 [Chloroflexota bacterium]|jgi:NitT/TauT family transport system permease protein
MLRRFISLRMVASIVCFLLCWEAFVSANVVPQFLLPAPTHIGMRMGEEFQTLTLWRHIWATITVATVGLCAAVSIGTVTAWLFYHSKRLYEMFNWVFTMSQSLPVVAIAPLILLWIQSPFWARVSIATVITMYPTFAATYRALQLIPRELREIALLNGASRAQMLRYVEFPLALPVVVAGVQTSVVLAMTGAVVGEYLGGRDGLGALINIARAMFDATLVFVALTVLVTMTLGAHALFQIIQSYLLVDSDTPTESSL